ncbi:MAG TPA: HD domain-containing protein [Dehalococcoidia bacterium]|nr:HD domain-containing protein [Dehalococcoidia bacterium]
MAIIEALYTLAAEVDAREDYTRHHSKKVSEYATDLARALGYSAEGIDRIRTSALLHDVGKIGVVISDKVLAKNPSERLRVRAHPYIGVVMLRYVEGLEECIPAIHHHHENYDGTGYPDQLKGDDIPLDARILAVADTFDNMISPRPYRPAYSTEKVLEYIEKASGSHFDPLVATAFLSTATRERVGSIAGTLSNDPED